MKPITRIFLGFTLALNLVLAVMLWRASLKQKSPLSEMAAVPIAQNEGNTSNRSPKVEPRMVVVTDPGVSPWQTLLRREYRECMEALRAAGCPEETIRDILIAAVTREFRERITSTHHERLRNFKWWKSEQDEGADHDRFLVQDLRLERNKKLTELLGENWENDLRKVLGFPSLDDGSWNFISREKRDQIEALHTKFGRLEDQVRRKARGGYMTDSLNAELKQIAAQKREALAQLLTPSELEDLDLRQSPASMWVRQKLPEARSEEEFRALVKIAQSLNKDFSQEQKWDPDETPEQRGERIKNEEKLMRVELAKVLGDERAANLFPEKTPPPERDAPIEEQAEPMRKELVRLATKEGLTAEAANQVHGRIVAFMKEIEAKHGKLDKIPKEKQKELEGPMKAEMEKAFVEVMGEKGRTIFKKLSGGDD